MSHFKRASLLALLCIPVTAAACGSSSAKPHTSSTHLTAPRKTERSKTSSVQAHETASVASAKKPAKPIILIDGYEDGRAVDRRLAGRIGRPWRW